MSIGKYYARPSVNGFYFNTPQEFWERKAVGLSTTQYEIEPTDTFSNPRTTLFRKVCPNGASIRKWHQYEEWVKEREYPKAHEHILKAMRRQGVTFETAFKRLKEALIIDDPYAEVVRLRDKVKELGGEL